MEVKTTKDFITTGIKIVVYGASGSGKTTLAASMPKPIILSAEGGLLSITNTDIPYVEIHNMQDLTEAYNYIKNNPTEYQSVVLDSISEIAEVVLSSEKANTKDLRQAYGSLLDSMKDLIRAFRDLPLNVYVTAKMEKIQNESGKIFYGPSCPGTKVAEALPYYFDEVFALRVETNADGQLERMLQTVNDGIYSAKDRSGKLNAYEKPDLSAIINKIGGKA